MKKAKIAVLASSLLALTALVLPTAASAEGTTTPAPAVCATTVAQQVDLFTPPPTLKSCFFCNPTGYSTPTYTASAGAVAARH